MKKDTNERMMSNPQKLAQMQHYWNNMWHMTPDNQKKKNLERRFGIKNIKVDNRGKILSFEEIELGELDTDAKICDVPVSSLRSTLLKKLHKKELVTSKQGPQGGYALHESAKLTSVAMIINALEGDLSLTQCTSREDKCAIESSCQIGNAWQVINRTIISSLDTLTLLDLIQPENIKQFISLDIPIHSPTKN